MQLSATYGLICGILAWSSTYRPIVDLHWLLWYEWVDKMLNEWMQCWTYQWKLARFTGRILYVNTAIAYLVMVRVVDFYPRCNVPNGPVRVCHMMALRNAKCENYQHVKIKLKHCLSRYRSHNLLGRKVTNPIICQNQSGIAWIYVSTLFMVHHYFESSCI